MAFIVEKPLELCKDHYLLKIDIGKTLSAPGQFANIKIGNNPLLRRPFSIYDHNENIIEIIFKVVGKGTSLLKDIAGPGLLDVIAPLGNGFSIPEKKNTLLIGGGVGNAPLFYLTKKLKAKGNSVHYVYASRSNEYIYNKNDYSSASDTLYVCTDDGTDGLKGTAGSVASDIIRENKFDIIYTCGPTLMMKSIVDSSKDTGVPVEVSLENYFGCGIGLCSGCTVETSSGMKRACIDGPVFDGRILNWDVIG